MIIDAGNEGFVWFVGVVEDRNDPLLLGRLKVRIYNIHLPDTTQISTEDLPWASVVMPITSAGNAHVGTSPTGITVGSTVVGFFMDGKDAQIPVVFGTIAGIPDDHDVPPRARGEDNLSSTLAGNRIGTEPASAYAAQYPFNKVMETESGHVLEIDDTPNNERINIFHKSGTYTEINKEGQRVQKVVGDDYEIIKQDKNVFIKGNLDVTIQGSASINVSRTCSIKSTLPMILDSTTAIIMTAPFVSIKGSQVTSLQGGMLGLNTPFGDVFGAGESSYPNLLQDNAATIASDNVLTEIEPFNEDMRSLEEFLSDAQNNVLDQETLQEMDGQLIELSVVPVDEQTSTFDKMKSNISTIYKNAANTVITSVGPIVKEGSKYGVTLENVSRVIANPTEGTKDIVIGNVSKFSDLLPNAPELVTIKNAADNEYVQTALKVVIRAGGDPQQFVAACSADVQQAAVDGLNTIVKAEMPRAVAQEVLPSNSLNVDKVATALKDTVSAISKTTADAIDKMYGVSDTAKQYFTDNLPDQYKRYA